MTDNKTVRCPKCGTYIGQMVTREGVELLLINSVLTNVLRGVCVDCGTEIHWSISERALAKLIRHTEDIRKLRAEIDKAQAELAKARSELEKAKRDLKRFDN